MQHTRHTRLAALLLITACGPMLPDTVITATRGDPFPATFGPAGDVADGSTGDAPDGLTGSTGSTGSTGDGSTGSTGDGSTGYGQCGYEGPFGVCPLGCAPGLFCLVLDVGSVCVAPCDADGCLVECYEYRLECSDAGACIMPCDGDDDCGGGQVCDEAAGVCVWPVFPDDEL